MIRLLLRLFKITDFEVCKSCETLKQQLEFERSEKEQLTATLLSIIKPKTYETSPIELQPVASSSVLFSRRRAAMEEKDRQEAKIKREQIHLKLPDNNINSIEGLEQELGVETVS